MNFNDLTKLPETLAAMEQRIEALEKEVADLKRQLRDQPGLTEVLIQTKIKETFQGMTFEQWDAMVNTKKL